MITTKSLSIFTFIVGLCFVFGSLFLSLFGSSPYEEYWVEVFLSCTGAFFLIVVLFSRKHFLGYFSPFALFPLVYIVFSALSVWPDLPRLRFTQVDPHLIFVYVIALAGYLIPAAWFVIFPPTQPSPIFQRYRFSSNKLLLLTGALIFLAALLLVVAIMMSGYTLALGNIEFVAKGVNENRLLNTLYSSFASGGVVCAFLGFLGAKKKVPKFGFLIFFLSGIVILTLLLLRGSVFKILLVCVVIYFSSKHRSPSHTGVVLSLVISLTLFLAAGFARIDNLEGDLVIQALEASGLPPVLASVGHFLSYVQESSDTVLAARGARDAHELKYGFGLGVIGPVIGSFASMLGFDREDADLLLNRNRAMLLLGAEDRETGQGFAISIAGNGFFEAGELGVFLLGWLISAVVLFFYHNLLRKNNLSNTILYAHIFMYSLWAIYGEFITGIAVLINPILVTIVVRLAEVGRRPVASSSSSNPTLEPVPPESCLSCR